MIYSLIILLVGSLCNAPINAGQGQSDSHKAWEGQLPSSIRKPEEPFQIINVALKTSTSISPDDDYVFVNIDDSSSDIAKPPLPESLLKEIAQKGWTTVTKRNNRFKRSGATTSKPSINAPTEIPLDEYSIALYEEQKADGKRQYILNHEHHGSYHKSLQHTAHIAHILFKNHDHNPARVHTLIEVPLKKEHKKKFIRNTAQATIVSTPIHGEPAIMQLPPESQRRMIVPQPIYNYQLALTCHVIAHHMAQIFPHN